MSRIKLMAGYEVVKYIASMLVVAAVQRAEAASNLEVLPRRSTYESEAVKAAVFASPSGECAPFLTHTIINQIGLLPLITGEKTASPEVEALAIDECNIKLYTAALLQIKNGALQSATMEKHIKGLMGDDHAAFEIAAEIHTHIEMLEPYGVQFFATLTGVELHDRALQAIWELSGGTETIEDTIEEDLIKAIFNALTLLPSEPIIDVATLSHEAARLTEHDVSKHLLSLLTDRFTFRRLRPLEIIAYL